MAKDSKHGGELWAIGFVLGYSSGNIFDKQAVGRGDPLIGPFLRGLPSLALGLALMWKYRTWGQLKPHSDTYIGCRAIIPFVWAGVISTMGLFLYYFAIRMGGVILTVTVIETWVIWGTLAAWPMLGEELHGFLLAGWGVIALGLACLVFGQLRGQSLSHAWYWALPLALLTAMSYGVSGVLWRDGQLRGAHHSTAIFVQFLTSVAVGIVGLQLYSRVPVLLSTPLRSLGDFVSGGVLSGVVAVYCIFKALGLLEVARVNALSSLTPLTATLFARLFLHEPLSLPTLIGVVMVCIGVTLTQIMRSRAQKAFGQEPTVNG
jgi:drug/metabolite transporter (DMT)-like permease